jgi:hypothetical protein
MSNPSRRPFHVFLLVLTALVVAGIACSSFNFSLGDEPTEVPPTQAQAQVPPTQRPAQPTTVPAQPTQGSSQPNAVDFTVINQSSSDVCFMRISPVTSSEWGQDWLGADIMGSGTSYTFSVTPGAYDLRAEFCGGGSAEQMGFNISANTTWTVTGGTSGPGPGPSGGTVEFTVVNQTSSAVCFVYISPTTSQYWEEDWLGADTIPAGGSYTFDVPSGDYDLKADFCGGGTSYIEWGRSITSDSSWIIPASATSGSGSSGTSGGQLDYSLDPNFGSTSLSSGFVPDPHGVGVTSGGSVDVSYLGSGCRGYATSAPDYSVNYTSGAFPTLRFFFLASSGDTTMIINAPDASFYCADDSFGTLSPTIDFQNPSSGRYDIWVGSYSSGDLISGTLYVTENTGNHP